MRLSDKDRAAICLTNAGRAQWRAREGRARCWDRGEAEREWGRCGFGIGSRWAEIFDFGPAFNR
jgi:hypothetical protein